MSRVQVLDAPIMSPGTCILCGSSGGDHRKFIDFGKEVDFLGTVYFCSFCIVEVMEKLEFIPVDNFDRLHESYRTLKVRSDQMEVELKSVKDVLANLLRSTPDNSSDHPADNSGSGSDHSEEPEGEDVGVYESSAGGESKADESSDFEGSDDLFEDSDFE